MADLCSGSRQGAELRTMLLYIMVDEHPIEHIDSCVNALGFSNVGRAALLPNSTTQQRPAPYPQIINCMAKPISYENVHRHQFSAASLS